MVGVSPAAVNWGLCGDAQDAPKMTSAAAIELRTSIVPRMAP
jgi:hypothetical protein